MHSSSVLIHAQPSLLDKVKELDVFWSYSKQHGKEEIDFVVDDIPYEFMDGSYQDPDVALCEFYGIDYNQVNCIELA